MNPKLVDAAQALEAERAKPSPSSKNDDDRLLDLFLANVRGDGSAPRLKAYQAMRRIVARLRREYGTSFTTLVTDLVKSEAAARGWL